MIQLKREVFQIQIRKQKREAFLFRRRMQQLSQIHEQNQKYYLGDQLQMTYDCLYSLNEKLDLICKEQDIIATDFLSTQIKDEQYFDRLITELQKDNELTRLIIAILSKFALASNIINTILLDSELLGILNQYLKQKKYYNEVTTLVNNLWKSSYIINEKFEVDCVDTLNIFLDIVSNGETLIEELDPIIICLSTLVQEMRNQDMLYFSNFVINILNIIITDCNKENVIIQALKIYIVLYQTEKINIFPQDEPMIRHLFNFRSSNDKLAHQMSQLLMLIQTYHLEDFEHLFLYETIKYIYDQINYNNNFITLYMLRLFQVLIINHPQYLFELLDSYFPLIESVVDLLLSHEPKIRSEALGCIDYILMDADALIIQMIIKTNIHYNLQIQLIDNTEDNVLKILSILTKLTASYNGPLLGTINTRNIELLTHSDNDQISSGVLLKAGQSLLLTWGKSNIYFFSYYKEKQPEITLQYNTIPVAIMALPAALITIFSVKLSKKIGFRTLIRLTCIAQFLALLLAPYSEKYQHFISLYFVVFGIGYSLIAFPVVTCIWSHFKEKEGKVTGLLFGVFGLATFCFVILITYIVNPFNEKATLAIDPLKPELKYFSYDVAQNAPLAAQVVGIISGSLSLIGGFLINHSKTEVVQIKNDMEETNPLEIVANQVVSEDEIQQIQKSPTLKQAAFSEPFLNIAICQSFLMYFVITLAINFKFYSLSKINDDYFITFVDLIALLVSSGTNVIWGVLIDKLPFKIVFLSIYFFSGLGAILLPILSYNKFLFAAVYILLMIFDKGALVIIGPGLLKLYGNQMGHQLYPFTHCGVLFAVLGSSLSTVILNKYLTFDEIFVLQGCIVIFSLIFIIRINMTYYQ